MSFNRVIALGNLVRPPETRNVGSSCVTNFTVATTHAYKGSNGDLKKETAFIDCKIWGQRGVTLAEQSDKGTPLYVEGRWTTESWEQDGKKRYKQVVSVEDFRILTAAHVGPTKAMSPIDEPF